MCKIFFFRIKYFYLVFISAKNILNFSLPPVKVIYGNLKECPKKILKT